MLWALVAMLAILGIAFTVVLVVAYPHRDELPIPARSGRVLARMRAALLPAGTRGRLWLDGRRG
ncbi:hypothetical protein [Nocardioides caldifontis]|uniref:hypothetical protein n=1 Tax=Nocardioides caldifontis TaxID=2588938 RepID=UPI0011DFF8BF|nr:hypothetical protein [Nocardioides caldifontis]